MIVRCINSQNVHKLLLATSPLGRGGSMQYFGKGPGFAEPWLSTKTGGGGSKYKNRDAIRRSGAPILI